MSLIATTARLLERRFNFHYDRTVVYLRRVVVTFAAIVFLSVSTAIVALDSIFPLQNDVSSLVVGDTAPITIVAPRALEYTSDVLTQQRRDTVAETIAPSYTDPDISVARNQRTLTREILDYVDNIRRDPYALPEQKINDLRLIRELNIDDTVITHIATIEADTWEAIDDEVLQMLEEVMQDEIRESELNEIRRALPTNVSLQFNDQDDINTITALVGNLVRPNTWVDEERTQEAIQTAVNAVTPERREFESGQVVVNNGNQISEEDYEALQRLGLLDGSQAYIEDIAQSLLTCVIVMVIMGLYISRFEPSLLSSEPRFLMLLAFIFLLVLAGARFGLNGQFYIYPTATMALLYVAIIGPQVAFIAVLGLAMLIGVMADLSLEYTSLVLAGGIIAIVSLKRSERINNFFFAGLMIAVINLGIAVIFNLSVVNADPNGDIILLLIYSFSNGILTAAATVAILYIITLLFNLPTALKISELSQHSQPLLQRLLREAPGTYQHSLQVANLSEQAATAIEANADLVHVAALYHDIGKMLNAPFFSENQHDAGNPHDTLNDPYRSADIIITHVTGGDDLARQYRLPNRLRDFIREHHGTSQVYVFYRQAIILAGDDESAVDISDFTYPGPKPQSPETAILMLADSCESAVRARQPKNKKETEDTVRSVIEGKRQSGQLDESNLTLNNLNTITRVFIEMLQAIYHPRVDYDKAVEKAREKAVNNNVTNKQTSKQATDKASKSEPKLPTVVTTMDVANVIDSDDDDAPLAEVPRLRRVSETSEIPAVDPVKNGTDKPSTEVVDNSTKQPDSDNK